MTTRCFFNDIDCRVKRGAKETTKMRSSKSPLKMKPFCFFVFWVERSEIQSRVNMWSRDIQWERKLFFISGWTKEMGNWNWISVVTGHLEGIDVQGKYDFQHSVYIGQVWLTCILPKKIGMAYIGQLFDFDSLTHLVL